jgi:hypothetical protein
MKSDHRDRFRSDRAVGVGEPGAPGCLCLRFSRFCNGEVKAQKHLGNEAISTPQTKAPAVVALRPGLNSNGARRDAAQLAR